MSYLVCHAQKQTVLLGMPHHIDRIGVYQPDGSVTQEPDPENPKKTRPKYPQIKHPELRGLNRGEGAKFADFGKAWDAEIARLGRKPQKNASPTVCFNISASPEFFEGLRKQYPKTYHAKCEEYFKDCRDVLDQFFPHAKTLKWKTHYEETTPHMHLLKPPIIKAKRRLNAKALKEGKAAGPEVLKFSSGEFLGGPEGLAALHDVLFDTVGRKWGLDRGERGSEAKHTNQEEWQRDLCRQEKAQEEKEVLQKKQDEALKNREYGVNKAMENLGGSQKIASGIVEHLRGATQPEINKFWPLFWKKIPAFVREILEEVKQSLKPEKKAKQIQAQSRSR